VRAVGSTRPLTRGEEAYSSFGAGAFAGGTPKQNAHDDIKNLAEWVSAGLTLECGAVARDHLAQNRLRHPVKLGQHVTPGDLGASPF
jgi:hypothetical protein